VRGGGHTALRAHPAALLGGSGALVVVGGTVLACARLVLRGAGRQGRPVPAPRPAMADAVPAR
jgi:hypothetical protein